MSDNQSNRQHHALPGLLGLKALARLPAHQAAREAAAQTRMGLPAAFLAMLSTASVIAATAHAATIALSTCTTT